MPSIIKMSSTIKKDRKRSQKGTAIVEFSIMLPLFLLMLQGVFFFGGLGMVQVDMVRLGTLGTQLPDSQVSSDMPASYFNVFDVAEGIDASGLQVLAETINPDSVNGLHLYHQGGYDENLWESFVDAYDNNTFDANTDMPESMGNPEDPYDTFDSLVDGAFSAHGRYVMSGGTITYELSLHMTGYGRYIIDNNLVAELTKIASVVDGWFQEEQTQVSFTYTIPSIFSDNSTSSDFKNGVKVERTNLSLVYLGVDRGALNFADDLSDVDANGIGRSVFDSVLTYNAQSIRLVEPSAKMNDSMVYGGAYLMSYDQFKFPGDSSPTQSGSYQTVESQLGPDIFVHN